MSKNKLHMLWYLCMLPSFAAMVMLGYEWWQHKDETRFLVYALVCLVVGVIFGSMIVRASGADHEEEEAEQKPEREIPAPDAHIVSNLHSPEGFGSLSELIPQEDLSSHLAAADPEAPAEAANEAAAQPSSAVVEPATTQAAKVDAAKVDEKANTSDDIFAGIANALAAKPIALSAPAPEQSFEPPAGPDGVIAMGSGEPPFKLNYQASLADSEVDENVLKAQKVVARLEAEVAKAEVIAAKLEGDLAKAEPMAAKLEGEIAKAEPMAAKLEESQKIAAQPAPAAKPISAPKPEAKPAPAPAKAEIKQQAPKPQSPNVGKAKVESRPLPDLKTIDEWFSHAEKLIDQENYDDAIKCYDKVTALDIKNFDAWYLKGIALRRKERPDDALYCINYALGIRAQSIVAQTEKGELLLRLGKASEAIIWFDKSLSQDKIAPRPWLGKGLCLAAMGKHKDAVACYDKVLSLQPTNQEAKEAKQTSAAKMGNKG